MTLLGRLSPGENMQNFSPDGRRDAQPLTERFPPVRASSIEAGRVYALPPQVAQDPPSAQVIVGSLGLMLTP